MVRSDRVSTDRPWDAEVPSRMLGTLLRAACAAAGLFVVAACSDDKPKAKTQTVERPIGAKARYADVKPLIDKSCVQGCHVQGGSYAGVPLDDLRRIQENRVEIFARLLSNDPTKVMPPQNMGFRTTKEGVEIVEWVQFGPDIMTSNNVLPSAVPAVPATGTPAPGATGTPGTAGPKLGKPNIEKDKDTYAYYSFGTVQSKIQTHCGSCHGTSSGDGWDKGGVPLAVLNDWRSDRNKILTALESGKMPKGKAGAADDLQWLNTEDGKAIYGWLKFSSDFQASQ